MGNFFSYPDSRVVETANGKVRGRRLIYKGEKQVDAFQGIPFAKPPVGPLRFEKPQSPENWNGIKETKSFAKRAIQVPLFPFYHYLKGFPSEDCLYLNVFTPCWEPPKGGFPVMVFLHGGGFEVGDTGTYGDLNICENIVTRDVIFVTVAYRLGYLGFFTTGDDACTGNFGLWDQTAALRWVNANIDAFGGDKNNITLIGQSAGAVSTDMLHLSPHSTGLFHKMICMAGVADRAIETGKKTAQNCRDKVASLGISDYKNNKELLHKLRAVNADKFAVEVKLMKKGRDESNLFETLPCLDGDFFPASVDEMRKNAIPKPLLTGVTKEEGILFLIGKKLSDSSLCEALTMVTREHTDKEILEKDLRSLYVNEEILEHKGKFMRAIANIVSDYFVNAPTLQVCRNTVANQNEPVYLYIFDHFNPKVLGILARMIPIQDTTHGAEINFLFNKGFLASPTLTGDDRIVLETFTTAFTNFAKFGNPNGPNSSKSELPSEWIPLDKNNCGRNFVFTASNSHMKEDFFQGRPGKYIEIVAKRGHKDDSNL